MPPFRGIKNLFREYQFRLQLSKIKLHHKIIMIYNKML